MPTSWWGPLEERFQLSRHSWLSGLVTMFVGIGLGIPGYIGYVQTAAGGVNQALIDAQSDLVQLPGWGLLSLPLFLLTTPTGLASMYLTASGFMRAVAAYLTDESYGDLLLTWLDNSVRRSVKVRKKKRESAARARLEGADVPDRLVTGKDAGRPEYELVVLTSRRKADWDPRVYLVSQAGRAFQITEIFDVTTPAGLRTGYALTELRTLEAIRHAIAYELPPLWTPRVSRR